MVELVSLVLPISGIFGGSGFLATVIIVVMIMRMLSKNKMKNSVLGNVIEKMGIAWIFTLIAMIIVGITFTINSEYFILTLLVASGAWWGTIIIKWKKEMH